MNEILSSYSTDQAVDDGFLTKVFENRWSQLSGGKPIMATSAIVKDISMAGIMEIWNEFVRVKNTDLRRGAYDGLYKTKMNMKEVWVMEDQQVYTIMYPSDY